MIPGRRRRSKWWLALTSVLATLVLLEVGLRVADRARGKGWNWRTSWYWMFEQDPHLGYRGRPNAVVVFDGDGAYRHNAEGFRDARELADVAAVPGRRLVICVGESSTYGIGAPRVEQAWPARLEAHLRRISGDDRWFVFNAGYPAYSSYQILQLTNLRLLRHRPEAVVMMSLRNDVELVARIVNEEVDFPDIPLRMAPVPNTLWNDLGMRSSLIGLLATRLGTARADAASVQRAPEITPRGRRLYVDDLAQAALLCRRSDVRLLVVDQPIFNDAYPEPHRRRTEGMREAMKALCRELDVRVLEADRPLHASGFRSPDDVHLGPVGYDRLAEIVAPQVLEALGDATRR